MWRERKPENEGGSALKQIAMTMRDLTLIFYRGIHKIVIEQISWKRVIQ